MIDKLRSQLAEEQLVEFLKKMKEFGFEPKDIITLIQKHSQETAAD